MSDTTKNQLSEQLIRDLANRYFTNGFSNFKVLSGGVENQNILIEYPENKYVLRILGKEHSILGLRSKDDVIFELDFLEILHSHNVPTPAVVPLISGERFFSHEINEENRFVICFEYLSGETPKQVSSKLASSLGSVSASIHNLSENSIPRVARNWPGTIAEITDNRIQKYFESDSFQSVLSKEQKQILGALVDRYQNFRKDLDLSSLSKGIIHGDLKAENIKVRDEECVALLDFDDCRETFLVEEIANTFILNFENEAGLLSQDGEKLSAYLVSYEKARNLTFDEKKSLSVFLLGRVVELVLKDLFRVKSEEDRYSLRINKYFEALQKYPVIFSGDYIQKLDK